MTKQLCKNCRYLETDGMLGIFCGVGGDNTKYDCPKYKVKKMTTKRYCALYDEGYIFPVFFDLEQNGKEIEAEEVEELLNNLHEEKQHLQRRCGAMQEEIEILSEENKQLKQEVELLREGLDAYDNNLPVYLTCREIRDFNSDLFEFKIKQQKFYNKHPNLCKTIIDGVELK